MTPPVSPETLPEAEVMFRYPSPVTPPAAVQRAIEMGIIQGPLTPPGLEAPLISGEGIIDLTQNDHPEGPLSKRARTGDHPGSSLPSDPPTDLDMTSRDYEDLINFEASEKAHEELYEESENRHVIFDPEVDQESYLFSISFKVFFVFSKSKLYLVIMCYSTLQAGFHQPVLNPAGLKNAGGIYEYIHGEEE